MENENSSQPSVVVLGASRSREKYGNKAVRAYLEQGFLVYPVNRHGGEIDGCPVFTSLDELPVERVDRVSFYLHPEDGIELLERVADLSPEEVWLNPGSESPELIARAEELGLETVQACSIVALGRSPGEF